jgi:hypothetical protein
VFVRLTDQEWFELFESIGHKDLTHLSHEDFSNTELEEFGIKLHAFEVNANVFEIEDKGKFIIACIRAGICPRITEE